MLDNCKHDRINNTLGSTAFICQDCGIMFDSLKSATKEWKNE